MRTVLVVDDHIELSEMVEYILSHEGYRVILAHNSRSAVDTARRENPHLILMDVMLPDRDGADTVRLLRAAQETQNTPIIFLTALASDESDGTENMMVVDGKTYPVLSKSLGKNDLLKNVKRYMDAA